MALKYVFADEAGNFHFSRGAGASRYFILTTVAADDCAAGDALQRLRRELALAGEPVNDCFHAAEDKQAIRDRVFDELAKHSFRIDTTILEKSKALAHIRASEPEFYKLAWYLHFKHVAPKIAKKGDEILIVGASLGTKAKRHLFRTAIEDVANQVLPRGVRARVASWSSAAEPCLQVADYCCWAIQRKWESTDTRSHVLIASKLLSEFDVWEIGTKHHY